MRSIYKYIQHGLEIVVVSQAHEVCIGAMRHRSKRLLEHGNGTNNTAHNIEVQANLLHLPSINWMYSCVNGVVTLIFLWRCACAREHVRTRQKLTDAKQKKAGKAFAMIALSCSPAIATNFYPWHPHFIDCLSIVSCTTYSHLLAFKIQVMLLVFEYLRWRKLGYLSR